MRIEAAPRSTVANYPYEVLTCRAIFEIRGGLEEVVGYKSVGIQYRSDRAEPLRRRGRDALPREPP